MFGSTFKKAKIDYENVKVILTYLVVFKYN